MKSLDAKWKGIPFMRAYKLLVMVVFRLSNALKYTC